MPRHFLDLLEISAAEARRLIDQSIELKRDEQAGQRPPILSGRTLGLLFEKPSLRTRVSFEAAIARLGGNAIFLNGKDVGLGVRESVVDFARVLSQYVDVLAVRTFSHATVEELARLATIPVINALSDASHPCQAMADFMTIEELRGPLERQEAGVRRRRQQRRPVAGGGLGPSRRRLRAGGAAGLRVSGRFPGAVRGQVSRRFPWWSNTIPQTAVKGADVVYTDVWASMGQEHEAEARRGVFAPYQVNHDLLAQAKTDAIFLHCLPAHRGEEVTSDVLDGPRSQVILQAANRLHFQMALLVWLLGEQQSA